MHKNDILALLSTVVGVASLAGDSTFGQTLDTLFGNHATTIILAALGAAGIIAGQVVRVLNAPAQSAPAPAPAPTPEAPSQ